jgi:signal transduction histidine kinase
VNIRRLKTLTIVLPLLYLLAVEAFSLLFLIPALGDHSILRLFIVFALIMVGAIPFAYWVFSTIEERVDELHAAYGQIELRNRELRAVNEAIGSISSALDLDHVLQTIADRARDVVRSRYAALGVADENGRIVTFLTSGITPQQRAAIGPLPQGHGLLGTLIREGKPLRIPNIAENPESHGFPPTHPPMTSLLGVPILYNGHPVGDLYLTDKIGANEFSEEDQDLLVLLASHAAVAIENARLYQEVRASRDRLQAWNEELELKVAERTREIQRYSKELTTRVIQAQEEERKRIARELHDDTAQSLSSLLISLDLLDPQIPVEDSSLRPGFERVRSIAKRTLDAVRALSHDLRPTILDDFGLAAAIHWFADEFTATFGIPANIDVEEGPRPLPAELELTLFRVVQEALTNSGKYACASIVRIALSYDGGHARLVVTDDGRGFDIGEVGGPTRHGGLGLFGMRERVELVSGSLEIETAPGKGTRVLVEAPLVTGEPDATRNEYARS